MQGSITHAPHCLDYPPVVVVFSSASVSIFFVATVSVWLSSSILFLLALIILPFQTSLLPYQLAFLSSFSKDPAFLNSIRCTSRRNSKLYMISTLKSVLIRFFSTMFASPWCGWIFLKTQIHLCVHVPVCVFELCVCLHTCLAGYNLILH